MDQRVQSLMFMMMMIHTNVMGMTFLNLILSLIFFNMILHEDGLKPTLVVCK